MHLNGKGVEASKSKALEFLERSAERGSVVALWTMGSWHLMQGNSDSKQIAEKFFAEADRLGHECRRPSEICDDFKPLFEDEGALIAANEYVSTMELSSC